MMDKYETPDVEFVELEENDVITSSCDGYLYGDVCGDF